MASRLIQDLPGRIKGGVLSVPVGISSLGCLLYFIIEIFTDTISCFGINSDYLMFYLIEVIVYD